MRPHIFDQPSRLFLPLAAGSVYWVISINHQQPTVAAEASFLGLLAVAVLLASAQVPTRIGLLFTCLVTLVAAVPLALPGTVDRAAALAVLLAVTLLIVAAERWPTHGKTPPTAALLALFLGVQVLTRSGDLLAPTLLDATAVAGWAALAASSTLLLAQRWSSFPALLAASTAFLLGPGFTAPSALALFALAAGSVAADGSRGLALRWGALGALLSVSVAVGPQRGLLLFLCATVASGRGALRLGATVVAVLASLGGPRGPEAALGGLVPALVLLPILLIEPRRSSAHRLAGLCLVFAAAAHSPDRATLAAPLALLALSTTPALSATPRTTIFSTLQAWWIGILSVGVSILAAYPWLREDPLEAALGIVGIAGIAGIASGWAGALILTLVFLACGGLCHFWSQQRSASPEWTAAGMSLALFAAATLAAHRPPAQILLANGPKQLGGAVLSWKIDLEPGIGFRTVSLDSSLSNSSTIPNGTPVAELRMVSSTGEQLLTLRTGVDTGEWAARRSDLASMPGFHAPRPHLSWVDASGTFFGQRYRQTWQLETVAPAHSVELRLLPGVPRELELTAYQLELGR